MLPERIEYDKIIGLLKSDNRVPLLVGRDFFNAFLDKTAVEPKVEGLFF